MIELSSRVAVAARSPAVRPRRGAGSLGQRPAPAPPTRSHGARGARCRPDPLPLAGGLRELPGCRPRRGGGTAAGRVAVGRERPTRPLRLQMPQPADYAHLRLLPALSGTGTAARPGLPALREARLPASAPKLLAPRGRPVRRPSARTFQSGRLKPPLQPPPCSRAENEGCSLFPNSLLPSGKPKALSQGAQFCGFQGSVGVGFVSFPGLRSAALGAGGESRELRVLPTQRARRRGAPGGARGPARRAQPRRCPRAVSVERSFFNRARGSRPSLRAPGRAFESSPVFQSVCWGGAWWRRCAPQFGAQSFKVLPVNNAENKGRDAGDTGFEKAVSGCSARSPGVRFCPAQ